MSNKIYKHTLTQKLLLVFTICLYVNNNLVKLIMSTISKNILYIHFQFFFMCKVSLWLDLQKVNYIIYRNNTPIHLLTHQANLIQSKHFG